MTHARISHAAMAALLFLSPAYANDPLLRTLEQNTRTATWANVSRATVSQGRSRTVRLTGPWMDNIGSVTASGGVSARNITRVDFEKSTLILDADESATRGVRSLTVNIKCTLLGSITGCPGGSVPLPIRVLATGPINHITPNGTLAPNTKMTFHLDGQALDVAVLMPRLLTLKSATITSKTSTTMTVEGTTPACGGIDIALSDQLDGDETPYRKSSTVQSISAGTQCLKSVLSPPSPTTHYCPVGQIWSTSLNTCVQQ